MVLSVRAGTTGHPPLNPGTAHEKGGLPWGRPPLSVQSYPPKGGDLLLGFFSRSSGRSGSGVSGRSSGFGSRVSGLGGRVSGSGGRVSSSGGRVGTSFSSGVCGRSFGGGGLFSSLFTASGEGEHAGSNGDSSKFLHDVWLPKMPLRDGELSRPASGGI